ncbi:MAG: hypothetical protein ABSF08_02545 [Candidatus Cybelea sp.]
MNGLRLDGRALGLCGVLLLLSGCGAAPAASGTPLIPVARSAHSDRGQSWMKPGTEKIAELLYVSDLATNDVFVYDYASGEAVGTLTGFDQPGAQCVDPRGDVFIATAHGLVGYRHGAQRPFRTLLGVAKGCVMYTDAYHVLLAGGLSGGSGPDQDCTSYKYHKNIHCWQNSTACYTMWPLGADLKGAQVAEGEPAGGGAVGVCSNFGTLSFAQTIYSPGSVMWDGKYLALTDEEAGGASQTGIYQTSRSGNALTVRGETVLTDPCDSGYTEIAQPFIVGTKNTQRNEHQGTVVVGGNALCPGTFDYWKYPAGGNPIMTLPSAPQEPSGDSVSIVH